MKKSKLMDFRKALECLERGERIIRKSDLEIYDQQWLALDDENTITYMNEPLQIDVKWLRQCMEANDWINVEVDCNYHDHNDKTGECVL